MLSGGALRPDLINKPSGGSNVLQSVRAVAPSQPLVDSKETITSSDKCLCELSGDRTCRIRGGDRVLP